MLNPHAHCARTSPYHLRAGTGGGAGVAAPPGWRSRRGCWRWAYRCGGRSRGSCGGSGDADGGALATPGEVRLQLGFCAPVRPRVDGQRGLGRPDPGLDGRSLQALRALRRAVGHLSEPTGVCAAGVARPAIAWSPDEPAVEHAGSWRRAASCATSRRPFKCSG